MVDDPRKDLADMQLGLLRKLRGEDSNQSFLSSRINLTARTLLNKRRRAIEKSWPVLTQSQGTQFSEWFAEYAAVTQIPAAGTIEDGLLFVQYISSHVRLSNQVKLERLGHRIQKRLIVFEFMHKPQGIAIAIRLPRPASSVWMFIFPSRRSLQI